MTYKNILIISLLSILFFSGCRNININNKDSTIENNTEIVKHQKKLEVTKQHLNISKDRERSIKTQNSLEGAIISLSNQISQNLKFRTLKPILITSFVRLDNLKKTSEFGRIVAESLIDELSNKNFNIIEFRGQMALSVNERGEYFITRNVHKMKKNTPNTYIVVGTYSRQWKKIILNARIIDNITGKIISSARTTYVHNYRNDCLIFKDCIPARTINIINEK